MTNRAYQRLRNWVLWLRQRREIRRELQFQCFGHIHPGDYLTVFTESGDPIYAEVLEIDEHGNAHLLTEDNVVIERALA